MSDTPRTDRWLRNLDGWHYVNIERARELERELNEANKTNRLQYELITTAEKRGVDKSKEELKAANERIKRLEEAGDEMHMYITITRGLLPQCTNDWRKAKEAKP
jgi:hypothetical protein